MIEPVVTVFISVEYLSGLLDRFITDRLSKEVVELLKLIQIVECRTQVTLSFEIFEKLGPVRQMGQRVVIIAETLLGGLFIYLV